MTDTSNPDLGDLTQRLFKAKLVKSEYNRQIEELNKTIREIEIQLLDEMQRQNLFKISDATGTVYIARQTVPKVVDWNAFYDYIWKHKAFHMLERRPSKSAFQEQHELNQEIPGVEPVVFDEVRTRKS